MISFINTNVQEHKLYDHTSDLPPTVFYLKRYDEMDNLIKKYEDIKHANYITYAKVNKDYHEIIFCGNLSKDIIMYYDKDFDDSNYVNIKKGLSKVFEDVLEKLTTEHIRNYKETNESLISYINNHLEMDNKGNNIDFYTFTATYRLKEPEPEIEENMEKDINTKKSVCEKYYDDIKENIRDIINIEAVGYDNTINIDYLVDNICDSIKSTIKGVCTLL